MDSPCTAWPVLALGVLRNGATTWRGRAAPQRDVDPCCLQDQAWGWRRLHRAMRQCAVLLRSRRCGAAEPCRQVAVGRVLRADGVVVVRAAHAIGRLCFALVRTAVGVARILHRVRGRLK